VGREGCGLSDRNLAAEAAERKGAMAGKRKKVTAAPVFREWAEVDGALHEVAQIDSRMERIEARYSERIQDLQEKLARETEEMLKRRARLTKDMEEFAKAHKDELGAKRHMKLNHGLVGFRWTPPSIKLNKKKKDEVLEMLRRSRMGQYIQAKYDIKKKELLNLSDEQLAKVGLKRHSKDEFWFELNQAKASRDAVSESQAV